MIWSVEILLIVHIIVLSTLLVLIAIILLRRGLFRWTCTGFWSWAAFMLYYVLSPLFSLLQHNIFTYQVNLSISGGTERGLWILCLIVIGVLAYYIIYLRTTSSTITFNINKQELSLPMLVILIPFLAFGVYSLITYRASTVSLSNEIIVGGRFTGQVSGYENSGYLFLFAPILLMLLADSPYTRAAGWITAVAVFFLALPNGSSRYALVSLLLAVSLVDCLRRKSVIPRLWMLSLLLIITIALQQRGHEQWTLAASGNDLLGLATSSLGNIGKAIGSQDTSMLSTWYLESFTKDTLTGYDYGLPLINYIVTGWIPNRLLPQKYFLVDWLRARQPVLPLDISIILYGSKSSLLGSFYGEGGLVAVLILTSLAGFLSRKMDGMLNPDAPLLIKTAGVAWVSILWMVWGSHDTWGVMALGTLGLPILAVWLVAPKNRQVHNTTIPIYNISGRKI